VAMPTTPGAVDLMIGFPHDDQSLDEYAFRSLLHDEGSAAMEFPVEYMFKDRPTDEVASRDPIDITLEQMDTHGIAIGLIGSDPMARTAIARHPDRFAASVAVDPNDITGAVRQIRAAHADGGIKAVTAFPAGCVPQVAVSDRKFYPIYQTCIDLDVPMITNAGVPGPRVPMDCQHVRHFDDVCYDFPELRIVMRHGAEPWEDLAVKLMLKWPNLYYCTSAFAPKHYPEAIIKYANTRGADKIMYAGYYPMGLTLDRIWSELPHVGFKDEVWPKFLRENAMRVFKLDE
jgi:predicted TIM-barrel fold metal-dependent hydrolase